MAVEEPQANGPYSAGAERRPQVYRAEVLTAKISQSPSSKLSSLPFR